MKALALLAVATLAVSTMAAPSTAYASTITMPLDMPADCSADVSAGMVAFFGGLPDGAVVSFPTDACYRVETIVRIPAKAGLTIEGNGATLRRTQVSPSALRYPKSNAFLEFDHTTGVEVRDLNIVGINPGDWDQSQEFDAGLRFLGSADVLVDQVTVTGVYGDGVQVAGGIPRNYIIRNMIISNNGRQGIGVNTIDGLLVDNVTITGSRRSGIDLEPFGSTFSIKNVEIRNCNITSRLLGVAGGGKGRVDHVWIHDNVFPHAGIPIVFSGATADGSLRTDWTVEDNQAPYVLGSPHAAFEFHATVDVHVRRNVLQFAVNRAMSGVALLEGSNARVADNWFRGAQAPVMGDEQSTWAGGNNSLNDIAPSATPWSPVVKPTPIPRSPVPPRRQKTTFHSFNVSEPAHKGGWIHLRGRLMVAGPTSGWSGLSGKSVRIRFKARHTARFHTVAHARSDASGRFKLVHQLRAVRSGTWIAKSVPTKRLTGAKAHPDFVRVR